ncbi:MAG TPA: hypothetical protein VFT09_01435, partial [Ilumatobacteraceae bacterium]|nr:hypothetical protein [Ilumatobacteraceae bacterium]
ATAITVDGEPVVLSASRELEWNVFTTTVDIAPGATVALSVDLSGQLARPEDVVTWTQPLVAPLEVLG